MSDRAWREREHPRQPKHASKGRGGQFARIPGSALIDALASPGTGDWASHVGVPAPSDMTTAQRNEAVHALAVAQATRNRETGEPPDRRMASILGDLTASVQRGDSPERSSLIADHLMGHLRDRYGADDPAPGRHEVPRTPVAERLAVAVASAKAERRVGPAVRDTDDFSPPGITGADLIGELFEREASNSRRMWVEEDGRLRPVASVRSDGGDAVITWADGDGGESRISPPRMRRYRTSTLGATDPPPVTLGDDEKLGDQEGGVPFRTISAADFADHAGELVDRISIADSDGFWHEVTRIRSTEGGPVQYQFGRYASLTTVDREVEFRYTNDLSPQPYTDDTEVQGVQFADHGAFLVANGVWVPSERGTWFRLTGVDIGEGDGGDLIVLRGEDSDGGEYERFITADELVEMREEEPVTESRPGELPFGAANLYELFDEMNARQVDPDELGANANAEIARRMEEIYAYRDDKSGLRTVVDRVNGNSIQGSIYMAGQESRVGYFLRSWGIDSDTGDLYVIHDEFVLNETDADGEPVRGGGFMSRWFAHLFDEYRANGVGHVEVHADIDVGGYAWAKLGYDWLNEDYNDSDRLLRRMEDRAREGGFSAETLEELRELRERIDGGGERVTPLELSQVGWMQRDEDEFPAQWSIKIGYSTMDFQRSKIPGGLWLGKMVMLGSDWRGRLEL